MPLAVNVDRPLRLGDSGDAVREVQMALVALGYPVMVHGRFDAATDRAVRAFRRSCRLQISGVVDWEVWNALGVPRRSRASARTDTAGSRLPSPPPEPARAVAAGRGGPVDGVDRRNVQGSIVSPLGRPIVRHLLFHFTAAAGARLFLDEIRSRVTMADRAPSTLPDPLVNLGLTFPGLAAVDVDSGLLNAFDASFREGPEGRRLGDAAGSTSDPATWWEGRFATRDLHCVVHLHAYTDHALARATADVLALADRTGMRHLVARRDGSLLEARSLGDGRVHFGYRDGIGQPDVNWDGPVSRPGQVDFRNFVLGYATDRTGSAPARGPAAVFARDGAYAAFRWIYQDVAAFNRFLRTTAPRVFRNLPADQAEELLAAKLVGRWRTGTSLVLSPGGPAPWMSRRDDFGYREDPLGHRCPFSAHARVVNPRDQRLDPVVVDGVPRVLRRGMPYGPLLAGTTDDGVDRGLFGIFVCSDLKRQFYTLTAWMKQNSFSPVYDGNRRTQDAVVGNRSVEGASREFVVPGASGPVRLPGLPDFVTTKGTAFLFYPGGTALARIVGR